MEDGLVDAAGLDIDAEFLAAFADHGGAGVLAGFDLAAGELPVAVELGGAGALGDQNGAILAGDEGGGDNGGGADGNRG